MLSNILTNKRLTLSNDRVDRRTTSLLNIQQTDFHAMIANI